MKENIKSQQREPLNDGLEEFVDERTRNKIDRHLHNIQDSISAEDIENIRTDVANDHNVAAREQSPQEQVQKDKDKKIDDVPEKSPTSWNVLGE